MIFGEESSEPMSQQPQSNQNQRQVTVDASRMETVYANMFAISFMPDEVTLFLGTNSMMPQANQPLAMLSHRVILNPTNAKRLMLALQQTIKAHEDRFGPIEVPNPQ
jgi:hypothetical protein